MKKMFLILFTLFAFARPDGETVVGQKVIRQSLVTWSTGAYKNKTRLLFLSTNVYLDTSVTGQAGQFVRIDNTADSCSNPFPIVADSNGTTRPVWEFRLWEQVRAIDKDSSQHVYRLQTRERIWNNTFKAPLFTAWTMKGANSGYADVTVQDSLLFPTARVTTKISQYTLAFVAGSWARLCPDDVPGKTSPNSADSLFTDSLYFFAR